MRRQFWCCIFAVIIFMLNTCSNQTKYKSDPNMENRFDWQGHRGARGLAPENTIPAFLKAMEYPNIVTLEMDAAITKDSIVVISHEPWLSRHICSLPDGNAVSEEQEASLLIYKMTYEELKTFDCGSRGNINFPEQKALKTYKPALSEVVRAVRSYCEQNDKTFPFFNIEIKSRPEWDNEKTPPPAMFAEILIAEIKRLKIAEQTFIQSFDPRSLKEVRSIAPGLKTVLLINNIDGVEKNISQLGFIPDVYSPHYKLVNAKVIQQVHAKKMKLIPWTVNETSDMTHLKNLGVDGIITDYPDRIPD